MSRWEKVGTWMAIQAMAFGIAMGQMGWTEGILAETVCSAICMVLVIKTLVGEVGGGKSEW